LKKLGIIVVAIFGLVYLALAGVALFTGKVSVWRGGGHGSEEVSKEEDPLRYRNNVGIYAFIGAGLLWLGYEMNKE